ncbi:BlaI/MecI/CopY family transcriptional regulator [Polaribacter porphyrae]|uniref:Transcriptional regulator n=1 Tax=Polaribacter porphyrae TaxID=1137780 RepID=A0A2S7WMT2_9FLAO|nr:BlaI/MecI/CopY family transcriptional regulator [Polaribacter porphyrae]PQJ78925.1 hypothetical protein BTO18_06910 [Polaribacter porphyrae]
MDYNSIKISDGELNILKILWENGALTVREIYELSILNKEKKVGYTTILKQVQRMLQKGIIKRNEQLNIHKYLAVVEENKIKNKLFNRLVNQVFKGSSTDLILHALGQNGPSQEEVEEIKAILLKKKEENDKQ